MSILERPEGFRGALLIILGVDNYKSISMKEGCPAVLHVGYTEGGEHEKRFPMGKSITVKQFACVRGEGIIDIVRHVLDNNGIDLVQRCVTYCGTFLVEWDEGQGPMCSDEISDEMHRELRSNQPGKRGIQLDLLGPFAGNCKDHPEPCSQSFLDDYRDTE